MSPKLGLNAVAPVRSAGAIRLPSVSVPTCIPSIHVIALQQGNLPRSTEHRGLHDIQGFCVPQKPLLQPPLLQQGLPRSQRNLHPGSTGSSPCHPTRHHRTPSPLSPAWQPAQLLLSEACMHDHTNGEVLAKKCALRPLHLS
jgi:hypothetical protein